LAKLRNFGRAKKKIPPIGTPLMNFAANLHRFKEQVKVSVKVKNQLDATKYAVYIASTCFGHQ
jgi:hypothetical protein